MTLPREIRIKGRLAQGGGRVLSRLLVVCLVFAISFSLLMTAPRPAHATIRPGSIVVDIGDTIIEIFNSIKHRLEQIAQSEALVEILRAINTLSDTVGGGITNTREMDRIKTKALLGASKMNSHVEAKQTNAQIDANTMNTLTGQKLKNRLDQVGPPPSDQYLCNVIIGRQQTPFMEEFAKMVANIVLNGADSTYRQAADKGDGPQYYHDVQVGACGQRRNDSIKTMNPMDNPPQTADLDCKAETSLPHFGTADMDASFLTIKPGEETYILPPAQYSTQTVNGQEIQVLSLVPDESEEGEAFLEGQRRFIKAAELCYNLMGPRPSPPTGALMETAEGLRKRVTFDSCRSQQNEFLWLCGYAIGVSTRPYCNDPAQASFCEAAETMCAAGMDAGIETSQDYQDCVAGITLYQQDEIDSHLCGATRRFQTEGLGGSLDAAKMRVLPRCNIMENSRLAKYELLERRIENAWRGLSTIQDCYANAQ